MINLRSLLKKFCEFQPSSTVLSAHLVQWRHSLVSLVLAVQLFQRPQDRIRCRLDWRVTVKNHLNFLITFSGLILVTHEVVYASGSQFFWVWFPVKLFYLSYVTVTNCFVAKYPRKWLIIVLFVISDWLYFLKKWSTSRW